MLSIYRVLASFLVLTTLCGYCSAEEVVGKQVENFVLRDHTGVTRSHRDLDSDASVVIFLGTECPLAKLYAGRLQAIVDDPKYSRVEIWGIMSNQHDSPAEIAKYAEQHGITFPLFKDTHNRVADQFGAERTPEAFLLDSKGIVRYHGRIDDQFGVGTYRNAPQNEDLKRAIDELLAGKKISVPETEAVGCLIGKEAEEDHANEVTYSNQIVRIFKDHCIDCHREGQVAPFALSDYDEVVGWASMIEEVVNQGRMPPWHADPEFGHFRNDFSLSESEKRLISQWVAAGAPLGDPKQMPEEKQYATDWQLPQEPDLVLNITKEPFQIPAEGVVKYQYFVADPQLEEDRWISAAEIRPGNHLVVHHILVFSREKGTKLRGAAEEGGFLAAYVPGMVPQPYPAGRAKKLKANSELVFQVHYTPVGSPQEDLSQIGFVFADPETVTHQVVTTSATKRDFEIPAGANNHKVEAKSPRATADVELLTMMPHMHLRGKSFRYEVEKEDNSKETILNIPKYDFNWQTSYRLQEPILLKTGTRIFCTAHFDNSNGNPFNPDATKSVRWGDQTWDEMMIGYFDIAIPIVKTGTGSGLGGRAQQILSRLDKDDNGTISKAETPKKWWPIFFLIDSDRNGEVTLEELEAANKKYPR